MNDPSRHSIADLYELAGDGEINRTVEISAAWLAHLLEMYWRYLDNSDENMNDDEVRHE